MAHDDVLVLAAALSDRARGNVRRSLPSIECCRDEVHRFGLTGPRRRIASGYQPIDALGNLRPAFSDPRLDRFGHFNTVGPERTSCRFGVPVELSAMYPDIGDDAVLVIQNRQFWRFPLSSPSTPFTRVEPAGGAWPARAVGSGWDARRGLWVVVGHPSSTREEVHAYYFDPRNGRVNEEHVLATGRFPVCQVVGTPEGVAFVCGEAASLGAVSGFGDVRIAFAEPTLTPFASVFPSMPPAFDDLSWPAIAWDETHRGVVIAESLSGRSEIDPVNLRQSMIRLHCIRSVE